MADIKINKIEPQIVEFYGPDGNFIGMVNEYEFNDVRIQICKEKAKGYYFMTDGKRMDIDENGKCNRGASGFFELQMAQLAEPFKHQLKKQNESPD